MLLFVEEAFLEGGVVAVAEGDAFVVEVEAAEDAVAGEIEALGVAEELHAVAVAVAPDEGGVAAGEDVEDGAGADVAAVEDQVGAAIEEELGGAGDGVTGGEGVADDSEPHETARGEHEPRQRQSELAAPSRARAQRAPQCTSVGGQLHILEAGAVLAGILTWRGGAGDWGRSFPERGVGAET